MMSDTIIALTGIGTYATVLAYFIYKDKDKA
jgi:hypothetical protein